MSCGLLQEINSFNKLNTLDLKVKSKNDIKRESYLTSDADYESGGLVVNAGSSFKKRVQILDDIFADNNMYVQKKFSLFDEFVLKKNSGEEDLRMTRFSFESYNPQKDSNGLPGLIAQCDENILFTGLSRNNEASIQFKNEESNQFSKILLKENGEMQIENHGDTTIFKGSDILEIKRIQEDFKFLERLHVDEQTIEKLIEHEDVITEHVKFNSTPVYQMNEEKIQTQVPLHVQSLFLPKTQEGNIDLVDMSTTTTAMIRNRNKWEPISFYKILLQTRPFEVVSFTEADTQLDCTSDSRIQMEQSNEDYSIVHPEIKQNGTFASFSIQNELDFLQNIGFQNFVRIVHSIEDGKINFVILFNNQKIPLNDNLIINCIFSNY